MWAKVLYFLRAFEETGRLVSMIFIIGYDIRHFLLVLSICIFGFASSFWLLSSNDHDLPNGTIGKALLTQFESMLGDFNTDYSGILLLFFIFLLQYFYIH